MGKRAFALGILLGAGLAGCRPAVGWDSGVVAEDSRIVVRRSSTPSTIESDELAATQASSLRDALLRAHPDFLRTTPVAGRPAAEADAPSVYIDNKYAGSADILQIVSVSQVQQVRLLHPGAARIAYGSFCPCGGGVIAVTTWGR